MQVLKPEMRDRIIKSARQNFTAKGFEKASMRKIAAGANMTVGNVYRYYKNKDAIFAEIIEAREEDNPRLALELRAQRKLEEDPKKLSKLLSQVHEDVLRGFLGTS